MIRERSEKQAKTPAVIPTNSWKLGTYYRPIYPANSVLERFFFLQKSPKTWMIVQEQRHRGNLKIFVLRVRERYI